MKKHPGVFVHALTITIAIILGIAGFSKLSGNPGSIEMFSLLEMEPIGRYLIGGLELLTAFLLLFPGATAWGTVLGWGLMTGALIAHTTHLGFKGTMLPFASLAFANWIALIAILVFRRREISFIRNMFDRDHQDPV